jgi:ABC-type dipeptide/oligopeptide/nickel transport system permease subunit
LAVIGLGILLAICLATVVAPLLSRYGPDTINISALNQLPSGNHWFGTDDLGRDMWSRILYGGRISIPAGFQVVSLSLLVGTPLGVVAGYVGRYVDDIIMRVMDILLAFPGILLAIGVVAILGAGLESVVVGLGVGGIPIYARVARGSTLTVREHDYVLASRAQGAGAAWILWRHIIPNIIEPLIILSTLYLGGAILATSALSFLGLGTQLPTSDWGTLLNFGYQHMFQAWSEVAFPGLAILLTVLGINLLGDGIGDALDPRR